MTYIFLAVSVFGGLASHCKNKIGSAGLTRIAVAADPFASGDICLPAFGFTRVLRPVVGGGVEKSAAIA